MTQLAPQFLLGFLATASLLGGNIAYAATFTGLSQARSVAIAGQITLTEFEFGEAFTASQSLHEQTAADDFGVFNQSVGLGTLVLDHPLGSGRGAGRSAQTSNLGPEAIVFDGTADVFMSGEVFGDADITGSGGASSRLAYSFSLSQTTTVRLGMVSELGPRNNDYRFALTREDGEVVWDQTSIFDEDGNEHRDFTQSLILGPGVYTLDVGLTASSFFTANFGVSGRALASFSITPVPLGDSMLLLASGVSLLVGGRRRLT